jgi:hypothetical protein
VLQSPSEQERVELLAVAGSGGSPTESGQNQRPVITPSTTFPAAVAGQQSARVEGWQSLRRNLFGLSYAGDRSVDPRALLAG